MSKGVSKLEEQVLWNLIISEVKKVIRQLRKTGKKGMTIREAIQEDHTLLKYVDKRLLDYEYFILSLIQINPMVFAYASERLKSDDQLLRLAMVVYCSKKTPIQQDADGV